MLIKFLVIMQVFILYWDRINALSESPNRAFFENEIIRDGYEAEGNDVYTDVYPIIRDDAYNDLDFNSTDFNDTTAVVEDLTVDKAYPDAIQISWIIAGTNVTTFLIEWFTNDLLIGNETWMSIEPNEEKFNYKIQNLEACIEYKIIVTPLVGGAFESDDIFAETAETQPGAPLILTADPTDITGTPSLNISWQRPKVGGFCVDKYAVSVETKINDKSHSSEKNTSDTSIVMKNLYACTSYLVTVKAVGGNEAYGLSATIQSKPTFRKVSEKPRLINSQSLPPFISNTTSIIFNWYVFDEKNNCTIDSVNTECEYSRSNGYGYELKDGQAKRKVDAINVKKVRVVVDNLSPYTHYICYGKIFNEAGASNRSSPVWVLTMEDAPSVPQNFKLINDTTLTFSWEPPEYMPGRLQKYKITFSWSPRYAIPDFCELKHQYVVDDIRSDTSEYTFKIGDGSSDYTVDIVAKTKGGWSSRTNATITFQTFARGSTVNFIRYGRTIPDQVTNLEYETKPRTNNSNVLQTTLSWNLPCSLRGHLKHFEVFVFGTKNHLANHTMKDLVVVPQDYDKNMRFKIVLGELRPQHLYKFYVSASIHEVEETGEIAVYKTEYPAGIPPVPTTQEMNLIKLKPNKMVRTTSSVEVLLPLFNNTNGDIKFYAIIVSRLGYKYQQAHTRYTLDDETSWPNISSWKEALDQDFEIPYQATEPRWTPYPNFIINYGSVKAVKYVIGYDVTCHALSGSSRLYCNGPLKPDTTYQVWMRAFTNGGYSDSDYVLVVTEKEMSVYLIVGVILGILMIGVIAAVILTKMSHYKGVKNPFLDEESDLERYRNRRRPINSNPSGHESTSAARTRRRVDQSNEQN